MQKENIQVYRIQNKIKTNLFKIKNIEIKKIKMLIILKKNQVIFFKKKLQK